jgi:hypothetical protein
MHFIAIPQIIRPIIYALNSYHPDHTGTLQQVTSANFSENNYYIISPSRSTFLITYIEDVYTKNR